MIDFVLKHSKLMIISFGLFQDCLKQWRLGSDKIYKEGNSECNLIINDRKKAVFYGNVDLTVPKDGKNRFAGSCGIKSAKKKVSYHHQF